MDIEQTTTSASKPKHRGRAFFGFLLILLGIGGYFWLNQDETKEWKDFDELTFSSDFEWTDNLREDYIDQETWSELSYAGPFYFGRFEGISEYTKKYSQARNWRTGEIIKVMHTTVDDFNDLEQKMIEMRGTLDWYVFKIIALEPSVQEPLLEMIDESNIIAFLNKGKIEYLNALNEQCKDVPKTAEEGFLCYSLHAGIQDMVLSYNEEVNEINTSLATLYLYLEHDVDIYQDLNKDLDKQMNPLMDDVNELMHTLYYKGSSLVYEERVLMTADYYFARDVVDSSKEQLADLEDAIDNYDADKESVGKEELAYLEAVRASLEDYTEEFEHALDTIDEDTLVSADELSFDDSYIIPRVYAIGNPFTWLGSKVKGAATGALDLTKAGANMAWSATKSTASAVKDITIGTVKTIGTGVGATLDAVDATVKTTIDTSLNVYYGMDSEMIMNDIKNNYGQVVQNFKDGKSGSEIYQNGVKVLESAEDVPKLLLEKTIGDGYTTRVLGFVAKTSIGFVTGAAKDAYTVLDPGASDADTLTSLAGLVMTAAGGTQSVMKGSQALGVAGKSSKSLVSKTVDMMKKLDGAELKGFFKDGVFKTLKKAISKNTLQNLGDDAAGVMKNMWKSVTKNSKSGYEYLRKNVKDGVSSAYQGMFDPTTYKSAFKSMFGMADDAGALKNTIGYLDNIIGSTLDDQVKAQFRSFLTGVGVSEIGLSMLDDQIVENREEQKQLILKQIRAQYEKEKKELEAQLSSEGDGDLPQETNEDGEESYTDYGTTSSGQNGTDMWLDDIEYMDDNFTSEDWDNWSGDTDWDTDTTYDSGDSVEDEYFYDPDTGCYYDSAGNSLNCEGGEAEGEWYYDEATGCWYDEAGIYEPDCSDADSATDYYPEDWGEDDWSDDGSTDSGSTDNSGGTTTDCGQIGLGNLNDCIKTTQF